MLQIQLGLFERRCFRDSFSLNSPGLIFCLITALLLDETRHKSLISFDNFAYSLTMACLHKFYEKLLQQLVVGFLICFEYFTFDLLEPEIIFCYFCF